MPWNKEEGVPLFLTHPHEYEPVDESKMPYLVDIRAIKAYADSKGVDIVELSDEEKQRFMIPNPNYRKKRRHSVAAML